MQEGRDDGLLDLAEFEPEALLLGLAGLLDFAFEDRLPVLLLALVLLGARNRRQIARGIGQRDLHWRSEEGRRTDDRRWIAPLLRIPQREREGPQHAPGALEALQHRPLLEEHVSEVRVEGKCVEIALLGLCGGSGFSDSRIS
mgnify:CR=1 FL=1